MATQAILANSFRSEDAIMQDRDARRQEMIRAACNKIAPLWPLKNFVAVNPFLGFSGQSFATACASLRRVAKTSMLMPRAFYCEALERGDIADTDLEYALGILPDSWPRPANVSELKAVLGSGPAAQTTHNAVVATVAEVLDRLAEGDRHTSRTAFMVDEISKFCAAYFDEGQASWRMPWRGLPLYSAWRAAMRHDRNPETMGIRGFRAAVAAAPAGPVAAILMVIDALGIPDRAVGDYMYRALFDIGGWASYARQRVWNKELYGREDDAVVQLLAIRLVWGYALFLERSDGAFRSAWAEAMAATALLPQDEKLDRGDDLIADLCLHYAFEHAHQRKLLAQLAQTRPPQEVGRHRKLLQAAFCIDVRSEIFRRALETVLPDVETIGFAGFFGFPIEYVQIGQTAGSAQCPVLLKPAFVVCESVHGATTAEADRILTLRQVRRRAGKAWKAFKRSAVSSFAYVEAAGLLFGAKLFGDSLHLTRAVPHPHLDGLDKSVAARVGPVLVPGTLDGRATGFDRAQRAAMAEAVLRAMSMTTDFARIVLLAGHGSTTVNNPHASGLDCGACGGHTGEANARVAAAILNDSDVRAALAGKGILIPSDTWFVAALHDTTTDEVRLFDLDAVPASHGPDLVQIAALLSRASSLARMERAVALGIGPHDNAGNAVMERSRDWSQVRPEWGLAGNTAFIAAPRHRTHGIDLAGRAFLHTYDWQQDAGFAVLELIMTAPMIVASWINLQYYGSTVNNRVFGSGNKVLHNVVGTIGVLEGNAGDLKSGLPWQSVHDGNRFVHQPLRLNVVLEAPVEAINRIIAKHESVRQLADNGWIHLFAISADGRVAARYRGGLAWDALS